MGHVLLGRLPTSKKWRDVVAAIADGESVDLVAAKAAAAADTVLRQAADDATFRDALRLLGEVPQAARGPDFIGDLAAIGIVARVDATVVDLAAALERALGERAGARGVDSDLGEISIQAVVSAFVDATSAQLPSLFAPSADDIQKAVGSLARGDRFGLLARGFFASVVSRVLDYYLSRELASHVAPGRRFPTDAARREFDAALRVHCFEAARIVQDYGAGWLGKTVYQQGGLTEERVGQFARYGLQKIRAELRMRGHG